MYRTRHGGEQRSRFGVTLSVVQTGEVVLVVLVVFSFGLCKSGVNDLGPI